jgi:hypothetical protein
LLDPHVDPAIDRKRVAFGIAFDRERRSVARQRVSAHGHSVARRFDLNVGHRTGTGRLQRDRNGALVERERARSRGVSVLQIVRIPFGIDLALRERAGIHDRLTEHARNSGARKRSGTTAQIVARE